MKQQTKDYLVLAIMSLFIAITSTLCYSTITERQEHYNSWNNSIQLLEDYYSECSTDSECEALESKLNFDFKKGMN